MIDYNTIATGDKAMEQYGHKEVRQRDNIAEAKSIRNQCIRQCIPRCRIQLAEDILI